MEKILTPFGEAEPIQLFKTRTNLIAYNGGSYFNVVPCKYEDAVTHTLEDGFMFEPIQV